MKRLKKKISPFHKKLKIGFAHAGKASFVAPKNKRIIICFDGLFPHGGFVDRLKGIVSFYEISKQLDYDFYIHFSNPFPLEEFLLPNKISWKLPHNKLKWSPFSTRFLYLMNDFNSRPMEIIRKSKANTIIVYANIDYLPQFYPEKSSEAIEAIWRQNFKDLFVKSEALSSKLNSIKNTPYVSIHTRFTSLMGDFKDTTRTLLSEEQKQMLLNKLKDRIQQIATKESKVCYVFSDSMLFLNYIRNHTSIKILEGSPKHMDNFEGEVALESHLKTLLDFFFIAHSEKVYFIRIDPMYQSNFSKYAAIIGNTPFKVLIN